MRNRWMISIAAAVLLGSPAAVLAQNAKPAAAKAQTTSSNSPDFSGVWGLAKQTAAMGYEGLPGNGPQREQMQLTPWAAERFTYNRDPLNERPRGRNELDP